MEIITCDPLIYTIDHPDFTCSFMENSIGLKRVEALRRQAQPGIYTVYRRKGAYPCKTAFPEPYPL